MIVQFGHPSPWHVGQSSRRLYSARSVGIGTRPRRGGSISSNRGPTVSYSFPPAARAGSGGLRLVAAGRTNPDVDRVDSLLLRRIGDALRRLHRGVRRRLVFRGLDDHAARRLRDRLGARDVCQRDDDVVVRREDVGDAPARHCSGPLRRAARGRGSGLAGKLGTFLVLPAFRGGRCGRLSGLPDRMQVTRDRGALVVRDDVLLRAAHEDPGDRHAPSADGHVTVDDELPRLARREGDALEERESLETPREDRLHVEGEDVVQSRAVERQEPEAAEPSEELLPFFLRLLVLLPDARLQFPRPLAESPQDELGAPEFLLVLQPVLLQELVLRLDALRLPRVGRPLKLRTRELRVAQRLTPWPVPSSLPSFLLYSPPSCRRLPPPSSPSRLRGRPSS